MLAEGSLGDLLRVIISLLPALKMQLVRSAIKPTRDSSRRSSFYFRGEICAERGRAASSRALRAHPERSASLNCAAERRCEMRTCEPSAAQRCSIGQQQQQAEQRAAPSCIPSTERRGAEPPLALKRFRLHKALLPLPRM